MNRGRRGPRARRAWLAGVVAIAATTTVAKEVAPFRVAVLVRWGAGAGSDAFRDDLARSLASSLATGCFAGVVLAPTGPDEAGTDVGFDVALSHVVDETRFDDSIAGALQPGDPGNELRQSSYFEVTVDASLTAGVGGAVVQTKHLTSQVSRRPRYIGEDLRAAIRAEAIDGIVRDLTRALGCGKAKLSQKIRESMADGSQGTPAPR